MRLNTAGLGSGVPAQGPAPPVGTWFLLKSTVLFREQVSNRSSHRMTRQAYLYIRSYARALSLQKAFSKELRLPSGGKLQAVGAEELTTRNHVEGLSLLSQVCNFS